MPGIIDTHSHMAIDGGVNEGSLSIVPEVRVKDVVTGDDVTIYQAAAGGVTAARLLHGSANTIGGQDAVIKLQLRQGRPRPDHPRRPAGREVRPRRERHPEAERPAPTASRSPAPASRPSSSAPSTRRRRTRPARRAYADADRRRARTSRPSAATSGWRPSPTSSTATIKIHSHCYRADEILMLLRTAERYGVRVQSLQHVLEGYKVAAEIAAHGASGSTFSDWWAYKVEAYDAIPYNAALLDRGRRRTSASRATARRRSATSTSRPPRWSATAASPRSRPWRWSRSTPPASWASTTGSARSRSARTPTSPSSTPTRSTASPSAS